MSSDNGDSQETDSQWIRRLATDSAAQSQESESSIDQPSQDSLFDFHENRKMVWPAGKLAEMRREEKKKKKNGNNEKENEGADTENEEEGITDEEELTNGRKDTEDENEEEEMEEGEEGGQETVDAVAADKTPAAATASTASAAAVVEKGSMVGDSQMSIEDTGEDAEEDAPFTRIEKIQYELTERMNAVMDMGDDVTGIIQSTFRMLLNLTTPETPKEEWKELMSECASNEEEKRVGDEEVETEYPREDMSGEEKKAAHRKLARMVVTR
ncbi:hypothetical protein PENTCL1PPCAC_27329, partial [Pristionchus entomophagus]